ncbi:MAG TPA: hypothetical protein DD440_02800 [Porticoccaceae bacterium]|nr:hypothetical protein [Porticoccaceae bacterium]
MDLNSFVFGGLAVVSLAMFFFLGRFKASRSQIERDDRIDWSQRKFSLWKMLLYCLGAVVAIVVISRMI